MDADSMNFLIAAYALTWVVLGSYAIHAEVTLRRARRDYARAAELSGRGTP